MGTNDLLSNKENKTPDDQIATEITKIGKKCMENGVEKVFVPSIVLCKHINTERIIRINEEIKMLAVQNGFIFIENDEISTHHLWQDGIHLNPY